MVLDSDPDERVEDNSAILGCTYDETLQRRNVCCIGCEYHRLLD